MRTKTWERWFCPERTFADTEQALLLCIILQLTIPRMITRKAAHNEHDLEALLTLKYHCKRTFVVAKA